MNKNVNGGGIKDAGYLDKGTRDISKVSKLLLQKNYNKQESFFGETSPHQKSRLYG
jgi:hypothetical protein